MFWTKTRKNDSTKTAKQETAKAQYDPNSMDAITKRLAIWETIYGVDAQNNNDQTWAGRR